MQYKEKIYGTNGCVMVFCVFCACYLDTGHVLVTIFSAVVQFSSPGCVIIVEVFLGNPCVPWKVGCLEKGTEREAFALLLLYLASFGAIVISKCAFLGRT